ncbi:hypothetical protein ACWDHW_04095 [Streptomyces melanosporofaciens]|uniref:hypothetical protein n=1 Tax=unclassified Streptomyces TaxID=2593676 RepID=UPI00368D5ADE
MTLCATCTRLKHNKAKAMEAGDYRLAADLELKIRHHPDGHKMPPVRCSLRGDRVNEPTPYNGPQPGEEAYDAATGHVGILQAICDVKELTFGHQMPGPLVAFLRPEKGGQEWMTDSKNVKFPEEVRPHPNSVDDLP